MSFAGMTGLEKELYEPDNNFSYAPPKSCNLNRKIAEAQGYIEHYDAYRKCFDGTEPVYLNNPELLSKYCKPISKNVRELYGDKLNIAPYQGDVKIKIAKLPTKYAILWDMKNNALRYVPVGKTFGYFNPSENEIGIDPVVFPELNDPERKYLKGMEIPSADRVITEELVHHGQKNLGIMDNYEKIFGDESRGYLEGMAAHYSDIIAGNTHIYNKEKAEYKKLANKYGEKKAMTGCLHSGCKYHAC